MEKIYIAILVSTATTCLFIVKHAVLTADFKNFKRAFESGEAE